jgi:sugar phosphate permease
MLGGSVMAMIASTPGQTLGVGVFTDSLLETWGLSRLQLSLAYMIGTVTSSFVVPFAGRTLDRIGSRVMVVFAAFGLGTSLALLSQADIWIKPFSDSHIVAIAATTVCFLFIRFFGQSCLSMVSRVVIGKWFHHKRGLATAISGVFTSLGFSASPAAFLLLIQWYGWRGACLVLAAIVGVGVSLVGWLIFRDTPESCGLRMDAATSDEEDESHDAENPLSAVREFTRAEALRTMAFWVVSSSLAGQGIIFTAYAFHIEAIAAESGVEFHVLVNLFLPMSMVSVTANLITGAVIARTKIKYLMFVFLVAELVGTLGLHQIGTAWGPALLCVGYGVTGGLFAQLVTVAWPRFYGREHLGAISGVNMFMMVFSSALAPLYFSLVQDWTGSFRPAIAAFAILPVIMLLFATKTENPQEQG